MLATSFNTLRYSAGPALLPMAANARIFKGGMIAVDALGNAVPASDTAGLKVSGLCGGGPGVNSYEDSADNSGGAAGARQVEVYGGIFRLRNSATAPATATELGKLVMVEDDATVAKTSVHSVPAGVLLAFEPGYAWVWFVQPPNVNALAASWTTFGV